MTICAEYITKFAALHSAFSLPELMKAASDNGFTPTTVNWTIREMARDGRLSRIGRGIYTAKGNQEFEYGVDDALKKLSSTISEEYPSIGKCLYKGDIIAPLLHHLSHNALTYIEVERPLTEILFHRMKDEGHRVYLKPTWELLQDYADLSSEGIIIKPLVSGSPLSTMDGVPVPTLEKMIVDTICDEDFSYLRGGEWEYMLENAFGTFSVNISRLLRYAGRRGKEEEISEAIKKYRYDK